MSKPEVSIVFSYFQRPAQLSLTLQSIRHHYFEFLDKLEIVCIDDSSVGPLRAEPILAASGLNVNHVFIDRGDRQLRNPGPLYNMAVELAQSDFIMLTNPENFHIGPVVKDALEYKTKHNGASPYFVFGCRTLRFVPTSFESVLKQSAKMVDESVYNGWYQHSYEYNRLLHFASFMFKRDYQRIGGFDPIYDDGRCLGYEDNDFVEKIITNDFDVITIDDPFVAHQPHARSLNHKAVQYGKQIFERKWGHRPRVFSRDLKTWRYED